MPPVPPSTAPNDGDDLSRLRAAEQVAAAMGRAEAYPLCPHDSPVVVHETHVSWVFLAGPFAFKIKKPIGTGFLDYRTLARREWFCHEECRVNRRYAPELYLGVVPITRDDGKIRVEGAGDPVEYAVKMQRFPEDALLSQRLETESLAVEEIFQLASTVAAFHRDATRLEPGQPWGAAEIVRKESIDNFRDLRSALSSHPVDEGFRDLIDGLERWTMKSFEALKGTMQSRHDQGFIRECHGDLHLSNVVHWHHAWTPFDGIEFNDEFRWIDILSDAAFLAMDFAAHHHPELGHSFLSAYLEQTGDYEAVTLLRWYLVYRSMVRAKVAAIRWQQPDQTEQQRQAELRTCLDHVKLASLYTAPSSPRLWITHGVSGSGKTTGSEYLIQQHGAIRLRSDLERKRLFGLAATERSERDKKQELYSDNSSEQTYRRLHDLAEILLRDGESVVVDATFLQEHWRRKFRDLAERLGCKVAIVPFSADPEELQRRIAARERQGRDASDADSTVLNWQLRTLEPLTAQEQSLVEAPPPQNAPDKSSTRRKGEI